jgi:hypothetical protein
MSDQAYKTPLIDLLKAIPADARMTYEHHSTHHSMIPVGRLSAEAVDEITTLRQQVAELDARVSAYREALERLRDCDWVITPHDRMDAVRDIARKALTGDTK